MNDVMDAVYDFIKTYAYDANDESLPQYADDQIIRAGLNEASAPKAKTEMCIIIHLGTIRHGTNHYQLHNPQSDTLRESTSELIEHMVQVDMLSAEPLIRQAVTARRAQLVEMIARSPMAVDFFKSKGFNILFAEDVTVINQWDDTKNYTARYSVKLRLEEVVTYTINSDYFTKVKVKSVRAHTADTRANEPGYLLTENIDNNHL